MQSLQSLPSVFPQLQLSGSSLFPALAMTTVSPSVNLATLVKAVRSNGDHLFHNSADQSLAINLAAVHQQMGTTHGDGKEKQPRAKKSKKLANPNHQHHHHQSCQCCSVTEKPFLCDWVNCGKRFRQKPHLEAHRNVHLGRRFQCNYPACGKSFVRRYNLVEHAKLHNPVNPNMCTYPDCGKIFSSKYSLVRHQNAQHNLTMPS